MAPLATYGAVGGLGPDELEALGVQVLAVDAVELAVGPGLARVTAVGGFARFTGWRGETHAVARWSAAASEQGWRGNGLPQLVRRSGTVVRLRSAINGAVTNLDLAELATTVNNLGIGREQEGLAEYLWEDPGAQREAYDPVATTVPREQARRGRFWDGQGWAEAADLAPPGPLTGGPLQQGCGCPTCLSTSRGLLGHLWRQHEITGEHHLCRHNLAALMRGDY
ncbi:MAG: hypothetical protein ACYDGR_13060 [Candidatus Dormibacteria bacterium]